MSQSDEVRAGEGTLSRGAQMVVEAKADFDRKSNQLEDQMLAVRSKWGGAGGEAFQMLAARWVEKHNTVVGALEQLAESLGATEKDFINVDQEQAGFSKALMDRLG